MTDGRIPVHVLTGFLGSGKTTLLRSWLTDPALQDTAVVVNEFGAVGLDHTLLREAAPGVALLGAGCVCCLLRDDLVATLTDLHGLAGSGAIPRFSRVVLETTGLADPAPIMQALMGDRRLTRDFRLGTVVATLDALNGPTTLDAQPEALRQAALADRLVLTKTDLAPPEPAEAALLRHLPPDARPILLRSAPGHMPSAVATLAAPKGERVFAMPAVMLGNHLQRRRIGTVRLRHDAPLSRDRFVTWLGLLLAARGDSVLRVKGLLHVADEARPLVVQGVQHVVHPPERLPAWPDGAPRTDLVFILRDLTEAALARSFRWVTDAPQPPAAESLTPTTSKVAIEETAQRVRSSHGGETGDRACPSATSSPR